MPGLPFPACHHGYVQENLSPEEESGPYPFPN